MYTNGNGPCTIQMKGAEIIMQKENLAKVRKTWMNGNGPNTCPLTLKYVNKN